MKKFTVFAVLCSMALSAAAWACDGNKAQDDKSKDGKTAQTTTQAPTTAQAPATSGK